MLKGTPRKAVAGGQGHLVDLGGIPCGDDDAAAVGMLADEVHGVLNLVYGLTVSGGP